MAYVRPVRPTMTPEEIALKLADRQAAIDANMAAIHARRPLVADGRSGEKVCHRCGTFCGGDCQS